MRAKAYSSVKWTVLSFAVNKVITFGTTVVLARLLEPRDFGLVALGLIVIGLLSMVSEMGLGSAIIVRQESDERALGTVLALMLMLGTLFAAIGAALSPLIALLFDQEDAQLVIMALCASTAIAGWSWFYDPLLRREFEFGRRFASLVTSAVCFAVVGIGTAVAGLGVWSLVLAQLANVLTLSLMQVILAPLRVRPCFDRAAARAALQSGRGFLTQTVAGFFSQNAASIVVAKVLGATQLGLFSRIYYLAELPYKAIAEPVAQVTFPAFARMRARGEQVERPFLSAMRLVALVSCPLGVILSAAAAPVVQVVYGDQWLAIIGPLGLLGIWATIRPVQLTIGWLLNSTGHAGVMGRIALGMLCVSVPALVLACQLDGLRGAVIVLLATQAFGGSVQAALAHRRVGVTVRRQFAAVAPILLACGAMWVVTRVVSDASSQMAAPATLALAAGAGLIAYLAVIAATAPDVLRTTAGQMGRILRRTPRSAPAGA